jgi:hypothetical protein
MSEHSRAHTHDSLKHTNEHTHDDGHHDHTHEPPVPPGHNAQP